MKKNDTQPLISLQFTRGWDRRLYVGFMSISVRSLKGLRVLGDWCKAKQDSDFRQAKESQLKKATEAAGNVVPMMGKLINMLGEGGSDRFKRKMGAAAIQTLDRMSKCQASGLKVHDVDVVPKEG